MATKTEVLREHLSRYLKASRREKKHILDHLTAILGMHRKAIIRSFMREQMYNRLKPKKKPGPRMIYTPDVTAALKDVWTAGNEVCGELLHPLVREYISILLRDHMWSHGKTATEKLRQMSERTMKRRVGGFFKIRRGRKGISATKPSALKKLIPIFNGPWEDKPPGWGQIDTVVHCGSTLLGDMAYTLNYTDAATYAVIPRAQWNKGMEATKNSMSVIRDRMPFPWLGAHPDTGSEFINQFVMQWCRKEKIDLSRSRPGKSNDNMYVEERNGHVIRKTVGYMRLDCHEAVDALNLLYDVLTPYLIHFVAVRRTLEKEKVQSKYRRVYEKIPKTPYTRILEHTEVDESVKARLRNEHASLNPLILRREIERRLHAVYDIQKRYGNPRN
ncbi:MAG: hypothetical protein AAB975_01625 [Patescibacteria group bacterium]